MLDGPPAGTPGTDYLISGRLFNKCAALGVTYLDLNFPTLTLSTSVTVKALREYTRKCFVKNKMLFWQGRTGFDRSFSNFWNFSQSSMTKQYCKQENSTETVWQNEALRGLFASLSELLITKTMGETSLWTIGLVHNGAITRLLIFWQILTGLGWRMITPGNKAESINQEVWLKDHVGKTIFCTHN